MSTSNFKVKPVVRIQRDGSCEMQEKYYFLFSFNKLFRTYCRTRHSFITTENMSDTNTHKTKEFKLGIKIIKYAREGITQTTIQFQEIVQFQSILTITASQGSD